MYHADHTLCTDGKDMHLFPSLKDRQLGSGHKTTGDELELAVRIFLLGFGRNDEDDKFLQERYETDEDTGVENVERRVEGSQNRVQFIRRDVRRYTRREVHAPYFAYPAYKPSEDAEHPDDAEEVEDQVRHGGTACLYRRGERHDIRRDGRTDILTQDERDTHVYRQHVRRAERHGDRHDGRRGLHGESKNTSHQQVQEIRAVAPTGRGDKEIAHGFHLIKVHLRGVDLQGRQAQEQEGQPHEEVTKVRILLRINECDGQDNRSINHQSQVERAATEYHNPCREGRSDIRTHDDGDRLRQRENTRRDEADRHDRRGRRGLHGCRDKGTGENARETIGRRRSKHITQFATCHLLQAFRHHFQSVHQHRDGPDKRDNL